MNISRLIREFLQPELKERRLLNENIQEFINDVEKKTETKSYPPKELHNLSIMILEKKKSLPADSYWQYHLEKLIQHINEELEICVLDFLNKYIERVIAKDSNAKNYLKTADKIIIEYGASIRYETIKLMEEMRYLEEYTHIDDMKETSETLNTFRYEILYKKDFEMLEYVYKYNRSFKELEELINKPLEYFIKRIEYLKKTQEIVNSIRMTFRLSNLGPKSKHNREEINKKFETLSDKIGKQLIYAQEIFRTKEQLQGHVLLLDKGYKIMLDILGETFAAHGTHYEGMIHHLTKGIPTGGQGGANFIINNVAHVFGNEGGYLITKFKYLLKEAYKHGAIIRFDPGVNLDFSFDGKTIITSNSIVLKNIEDIKSFLVNDHEILLQIEKNDNIKLKVPWVVVTDRQEIQEDITINTYAKKLFYTQEPIFGSKLSVQDLTVYLMNDSTGIKYLNKYL